MWARIESLSPSRTSQSLQWRVWIASLSSWGLPRISCGVLLTALSSGDLKQDRLQKENDNNILYGHAVPVNLNCIK